MLRSYIVPYSISLYYPIDENSLLISSIVSIDLKYKYYLISLKAPNLNGYTIDTILP